MYAQTRFFTVTVRAEALMPFLVSFEKLQPASPKKRGYTEAYLMPIIQNDLLRNRNHAFYVS